MRILYMGNNWIGWQVLKWLKEQNEEIVGLVVHPVYKQKYANEILQAARLPEKKIFDGSQLKNQEMLESIKKLEPDIGLSILFGYIIKPEFLSMFPHGLINLHPSYLPYNRGQYPNVWSIVERTPAGTTLHYIDKSLDSGDIIARKKVSVQATDTGETLYHKLEHASLKLFQETWPLIKSRKVRRIQQDMKKGTCHLTKDVELVDKINLNRHYLARDLINIIRARTFPPYKGAYFIQKRQKVYLRLQLLSEKEIDKENHNES